ncbi:MAG: hypothetical protein LCI02_05055 [Proteobacteria bacterium]|nr:hypothetical protein [Pseudomonadota bacterium]
MRVVAEQSTAVLSATFTDRYRAPAAPASVKYRIDCQTTGVEVRGWTDLAAAEAVDIVLTPADTALIDQAHESERRLVTVVATYGANDQVQDACDYYIRNLEHAS